MSMVVQHNMQAMNANRMLGVTTSQQAKSTEKLSSGYRINRAADDAAGLSISEKMRKQIRGLDQASSNAQDGISSVQTAEGALTEVHSMLQRMNELANQAANGTNSEDDRRSIQDEIDQLTTEIDRVAETTKFNEIYLLKGDAEGAKTTMTVNAHDAGIKGTLTANDNGTSTFKLNAPLKAGDKITVAGKELTIGDTKTIDDYDTLANVNNQVLEIGDKITRADGTELNVTNKALADDARFAVSKLASGTGSDLLGTLTLADGTTYTFTDDTDAKKLTVTETKAGVATSKVITLTGADGTDSWDAITGVTNIDVSGATFTDKDGKTYELVSKLNRDELTAFDKTTGVQQATMTASAIAGLASNGAVTLGVGDSVTFNETTATGDKIETTKIAYDGTNAAAGLTTLNDLATKLGKLAVDTAVRVASSDGDVSNANATNGKYTEYTIAGSKDAENGSSLTVDSILAKVREGSIVGWDADGATGIEKDEAYAVVGVDSEEGTTSVKDAYKQIADALTAASSIGTEEAAITTSNGDGSFTIKQGTIEVTKSLNFNLHVGADADMTNKINVDVGAMDSAALGIKGINVKDSTGVSATYAIDAIEDAIKTVSAQRSALGAVQNRLEHTIANLDNIVENTTSAESAIRDTDMAEEMVTYSKNNILAQAGQSMLAQANQSNQGVLSLLG